MDPYLYLFDGAKIMHLIELSKSISNYLQTQGFAGAPKLLLILSVLFRLKIKPAKLVKLNNVVSVLSVLFNQIKLVKQVKRLYVVLVFRVLFFLGLTWDSLGTYLGLNRERDSIFNHIAKVLLFRQVWNSCPES